MQPFVLCVREGEHFGKGWYVEGLAVQFPGLYPETEKHLNKFAVKMDFKSE